MFDTLLNLSAYCPNTVLAPETGDPITLDRLAAVLPPSLAEQELSTDPLVPVPVPMREIFARYRPTPLFEARTFAEAVGNGCRVFVKDEGVTPSGNHKANSAWWIAYHCARDGISKITTETTGNWGIALALAAAEFDLEVICFIDEASRQARPDRTELMRAAGAQVEVVHPDDAAHFDPLVLSANYAVEYTRRQPGARYVFGSVYNYFILPQTIVGLEAREQLGDLRPDVVVGSCGGGANLLGVSGAFLADRLAGADGPEVVCAESDLCPIVSKGVLGRYSIDDQCFYPKLHTYGLERLLGTDYIGGLGSTVVAAPVARFHAEGLIRTTTVSTSQAQDAATLFAKTEGRTVALETGYQLAAVITEARRAPGRSILVNVSSVGRAAVFA